ncbi:zinc finger domain-containing protein [Streptomyces boncukensis]|uniref:DNA-binding phage zinc finger domain-containing protein n=1 Tax=Streptomyces boncukensis TaxID=2711219 RepID=A0A6G4X7V8_9ACTN|nr:hypothetical protein [Streptomyces boncukensis]NGO73468.1 hypothetical protein [Streptomyces boncukensis]
MNADEAAELLAHCSGFDNRQPSLAAAIAWASALLDIPLDEDAKNAVAAYYTTPPQNPSERLWILPHHVRSLRTKIRNARLENFRYEPLSDETTSEYLARYRGQVHVVASGRVAPPTGNLQLTGGPSRQFTQGLEDRGWSVGREVPDTDAEAVADSVRRAGPLGVVCPTCTAPVGHGCRTPGGSDKQPLGKPRKHPHSARRRAAKGEPELTPEQQAVAEQRIREASRAALARLDDVPDAEIVDDAEAAT